MIKLWGIDYLLKSVWIVSTISPQPFIHQAHWFGGEIGGLKTSFIKRLVRLELNQYGKINKTKIKANHSISLIKVFESTTS